MIFQKLVQIITCCGLNTRKGVIEQQVQLLLMISWGSKSCDHCCSILKSSLARGNCLKMLLHLDNSVVYFVDRRSDDLRIQDELCLPEACNISDVL